ncbi:MAG: CotH kinase family protein [Lachnospiraceae bacterium]|nr:CotH kinase family protein [Lachnospiraceae bacterium]
MHASTDHDVYCYGTISIVVPEGFHYPDFPDLDCESLEGLEMSIRGRGNSTWNEEKKPYKIKLDKKTDVFGLGKNKHWVLLANSKDDTLLRDRITAWLGDGMGFDFTPRGVPVDVVMTGEYFGTQYLGSYYLSENVRVDDNRLEIEELEEGDTDPDIITGGYLLQNALQVRKGSPDRFYTSRGVDWATHTPSFDTEENALYYSLGAEGGEAGENTFAAAELSDAYENPVQQEYIQQYMQLVEDVIYEGTTAYRDYMDVENSAKYWLVNAFTLNNDAYATGSTYIYKDRDPESGGSKLYWGPLWDFDYAWNFNTRVTGLNCGHKWIKPLFYDKEEGGFVAELHKQWPGMKELLEELIAEGGVIDGYYEETRASAEADAAIYHPESDFDYQARVEALKDWIRRRIDWVDENFSMVDDMVHRVTFVADGELFAYEYYEASDYLDGEEDFPEKDGYTFVGWADEDGNVIRSQTFVSEDMILTAQYVPDDTLTHAKDLAFAKDGDTITYNAIFRSYTIPYVILPVDAEDQRVTWTSSDENIVRITRYGQVVYESPGVVTFTASLRLGGTRTFTLTITNGDLPVAESISLEEDSLRLRLGDQVPLMIRSNPSDAKIFEYRYVSDNENIVTVGDLGVVTAVGTGRTRVHVYVTAMGPDGDDIELEANASVIVSDPRKNEEESEGSTEESIISAESSSGQNLGAAHENSGSAGSGSHIALWVILCAAAAAFIAFFALHSRKH